MKKECALQSIIIKFIYVHCCSVDWQSIRVIKSKWTLINANKVKALRKCALFREYSCFDYKILRFHQCVHLRLQVGRRTLWGKWRHNIKLCRNKNRSHSIRLNPTLIIEISEKFIIFSYVLSARSLLFISF